MPDAFVHPTYRALLADVLAAPADDFPRLKVADFLEEQGDVERAEFIRVQCEVAKPEVPPLPGCVVGAGPRGRDACGWCWGCQEQKSYNEKRADLRRRERELLDRNAALWLRQAHTVLVGEYMMPPGTFDLRGTFRRGFVHSITCTWADWAKHCDAILACQPIAEVTLTTGVWWWTEDYDHLELYEHEGRTGEPYHCRRARFRSPLATQGSNVIQSILLAEWNGIEFHLPT